MRPGLERGVPILEQLCGGASHQTEQGRRHDERPRQESGWESCSEQGAGQRKDFVFAETVLVLDARGVAAYPHDKGGIAIVVGKRHVEIFGLEIFTSANMHPAQKTPRLFALQDHVADSIPTLQMLAWNAVFKGFSGVM